MTTFRRVPYGTDPEAQAYHAAHAHALTKSAKDPAKFAWWYVDYRMDTMTVAEAWEAAPEDVKDS